MPDINILVVDDEKEIADLIEIYLVSDGYKVFKAENAAKGLEIISKEEVHLVLSVSYTHLPLLRLWRRQRTMESRCRFWWS